MPLSSGLSKMVESDRCVLCWNGSETGEHLLHSCRYTRQVGREIRMSVGYSRQARQTWNPELQWVIETTAAGDGVQQWGLKQSVAAMVYWVWSERRKKQE